MTNPNEHIEYWASPMEFDAKGGFHEIVKFKDRYLEPQCYGMYYDPKNLTILWVADYDKTMSMVTLWGAKHTDAASSQTPVSGQA